MQKYMLNQKKIKDTVYNLKWNCPYCDEENIEYHFQNWEHKLRFWCVKCHKVVYKGV